MMSLMESLVKNMWVITLAEQKFEDDQVRQGFTPVVHQDGPLIGQRVLISRLGEIQQFADEKFIDLTDIDDELKGRWLAQHSASMRRLGGGPKAVEFERLAGELGAEVSAALVSTDAGAVLSDPEPKSEPVKPEPKKKNDPKPETKTDS